MKASLAIIKVKIVSEVFIMIDREDIDPLKEIFVTRLECDTITDDINKKLANDSTELALIKQKLDTISWVSKTTLGAVLVAIVGALLSLILK